MSFNTFRDKVSSVGRAGDCWTRQLRGARTTLRLPLQPLCALQRHLGPLCGRRGGGPALCAERVRTTGERLQPFWPEHRLSGRGGGEQSQLRGRITQPRLRLPQGEREREMTRHSGGQKKLSKNRCVAELWWFFGPASDFWNPLLFSLEALIKGIYIVKVSKFRLRKKYFWLMSPTRNSFCLLIFFGGEGLVYILFLFSLVRAVIRIRYSRLTNVACRFMVYFERFWPLDNHRFCWKILRNALFKKFYFKNVSNTCILDPDPKNSKAFSTSSGFSHTIDLVRTSLFFPVIRPCERDPSRNITAR